MMSTTWYSKRTKKTVSVVLNFKSIIYVEDGYVPTSDSSIPKNRIIIFDRWSGCHLDDLHLKVDCVEIYNDPRFEYWLESGEFNNVEIKEIG